MSESNSGGEGGDRPGAQIVNLRLARKRRRRQDEAERAERNRAIHGRGSAERRASEAESARVVATLDGARRVPPDRDE